MEKYTTIAGEEIAYPTPAPDVAALLSALVDAVNDPIVSESEIIELIYGKENPLLRQDVLPHHGVVTKEVFDNPLYHVMTDLLGRKRVQLGTLNVDKALSQYTMTVSEAAEELGIHPSAVRQAIKTRRLAGVKKGSQYFLRPLSVRSYKVSQRGPKRRKDTDEPMTQTEAATG